MQARVLCLIQVSHRCAQEAGIRLSLTPKGRLVVYPKEGHSVTISRAFFRDVLAFLAESTSTAASRSLAHV